MAIGYLFKKLSEQELHSKAHKERSSAQASLRQAANSIESGQPAEEIQALIDASSRGIEDAAVWEGKHDELVNRFVPNVLKQLEEKYGIQEPPKSFILIAAAALLSETGGEESLKVARLLEQLMQSGQAGTQVEAEKKSEKGVTDLSGRQEAILRSVFRIPKGMEEVPAEMSLNEAISLVYPDEVAETGVDNIRNKRVSVGKTEVFNRLRQLIIATLQADEEITLEEVGKRINNFNHLPTLKSVVEQMVEIESYRDKKLFELIEYARPNGPIRLRENEAEENHM